MTRPAASPGTAACTGEDVKATCLVPYSATASWAWHSKGSLCLYFAALMASLGFCSLPKAVSRGFQAWGSVAVGTLSGSRLE